ncbi:uncharacterized protein B0P05DRAFT_590678 [Gilbertella persicaria]|uniref:Homeobox domain-containing protein n=1 Tax=Rhizopus stolonifer TaxID=4846 RepID=A0A367KRR2_RHIST|nr:uncharacterized protein B0P05DRAFT_590678 [Gilbertella persicaria]KAI8061516.1 hypothetical protein B0P05DRAFT_590678 [Gilbertella persicaria]RCI04871.1 hypothetical protein CU098_010552 [Rhizopus stolonifer]
MQFESQDQFDIHPPVYVPDVMPINQASHVKNTDAFMSTMSNLSSPEVYSPGGDLQYSCDSLTVSFSHASLNSQFGLPYFESLDESDDEQQLICPSPETILFYEMLHDYPNLSTFICHREFGTFCYLWLELQRAIFLAKEPKYRPHILSWLKSAALQIHFMLVFIVKSNPGNNDMKSEARCIFSAFRRLKDRIEIMHQVFQLIENGRVWFNQSPLEAISPLVEAATKIKKEINYFSNNSDVIPVIGMASGVDLVSPDKVSFHELSNRVIHTYNIMPYNKMILTKGSLTDDPCQQPDTYQKSESSKAPFSHIQPSWIHDGWSLPVTPSVEQHQHLFFSLPTSPTCIQQEQFNGEDSTYIKYDLSFSPGSVCERLSPNNTVSDDTDYDDRLSKTEKEDDEYIVSEADEDDDIWNECAKRKSRRTGSNRRASSTNSSQNQENARFSRGKKDSHTSKGIERKYTRRTATSYDAQTTHYLKTIFFDIYSSRDKLTKDQRRQVQKETGLKPRNITYWFSNHKRRFQTSLAVFRRVVGQSGGQVKTYDDFLAWRQAHGLPEEVLEEELDDKTDPIETP